MDPLDNKRILLTSYSGRFAGMERRLVDEAGYLKGAGAEVTVATRQFRERPILENALRPIGVAVRDLDPPPFLSDWKRRHRHRLKAMWFRPDWLSAGEFDLARVCMPWANRGLENIWLFSRLAIPTIVSAHNTFPGRPMTSRWHAYYLGAAFENVHGVVGLARIPLERFQGSFSPYLDPHTIQRVIHNAVDTEKFTPSRDARTALRKRLGLAGDTPVVGSVGRLSDHKRPVELVDVFERVHERKPETRFVLIGEGELRSEVERAISRKGLDGIVMLMGEQPEVEGIMAGLDVHVLVSKVEGFASVNAEAMACEVPVVATDIPGTNEVVEDGKTGYLVAVGETGRAADRVVTLLSAPGEARAMGRAGRDRVSRLFSVERRRQAFLRLYTDVLELAAAGAGGNGAAQRRFG